MKKLNLSCDECNATYSLSHDLSTKHYFPEYCPFCGEPLPADDDIDEEESEDMDDNDDSFDDD